MFTLKKFGCDLLRQYGAFAADKRGNLSEDGLQEFVCERYPHLPDGRQTGCPGSLPSIDFINARETLDTRQQGSGFVDIRRVLC